MKYMGPVWRGECLDQCNRIHFSSKLHSLTALLISSFDSGAHDDSVFSVMGYHYRGYTTGVRTRVAKMTRVIRVRVSLSSSGRKG